MATNLLSVGERLIAGQRALIENLHTDGRDTTAAERLLRTLEDVVASTRKQLAIEENLTCLGFSDRP